MSHLTRRGFVKSSAAATAGLTVFGVLGSEEADARAAAAGSEPVMAYVSDPASGEVTVITGDQEVHVHDPKLAARIARAAR